MNTPTQTSNPAPIENPFFRANVDLLLKSLPIIGLLIYVTGYLIRLIYFRNINIHTIEFFKAQCLEAGVSFAVLSIVLLGLFALAPLIVFMHSAGLRILPPHVSPIPMLFSVAAVAIVILSSITIVFFIPPQHFPLVRNHFSEMLVTAVVLLSIVGTISMLLHVQRISQNRSAAKVLSKLAEFLRLILFASVAYCAFLIFFRDATGALYVFLDSTNLFYLEFLILFAVVVGRIMSRFSQMSHEPHGGEVPKEVATDVKVGLRKELWRILVDRLAFFILIALASVLFYLVVISYTFGPFLYISTSRGGAMQYSTVRLVVREQDLVSPCPFFLTDTKISTPLYLLDENDSSIYVTLYKGAQNPRTDFLSMSSGITYAVDKKEVVAMLFDRIK